MSGYRADRAHPGAKSWLIKDAASDLAVACVPGDGPREAALAARMALGLELVELLPGILADCAPVMLHGRTVGAEIGLATLVLLRQLAERCRACAAGRAAGAPAV